MHTFKTMLVKSSLVLFAFSLPLSTFAQIEEITVTAQKREESVQDIPIAINALTGDMLDEYGVDSVDDLEFAFVGITTNDSGPATAGMTIRGVGTSSFHISTQQSVGIYIDNVYQISPFTSAIGAFDMERVEVLRGPQNTLYGRNTTGGAINMHSRSAEVGEEFNGYGRFTAGRGDRLDFEGAVGGSLSDTLAGRVAFVSNNYDGVLGGTVAGNNTVAGNVDENDSWSIRASMTWEPTDNFSTEFKYTHGDAEGDGLPVISQGYLNAGGTGICPNFANFANSAGPNGCTVSITPGAAAATGLDALGLASDPGTFAGGIVPGSGGQGVPGGMAGNLLWAPGGNYYNTIGQGYEFDYDIFNLYLTYQLGDSVELSSVTSYLEQFYQNSSGINPHTFSANNAGDWEVWQQEFRAQSTTAGPLRWIAGLYYSSSESTEDTWVMPGAFGVSNSILIDAEFESVGLYGQFEYDLSDTFTLTAGVRYSEEELAAPPLDAANGVYGYRKFFCTPAATGGQNAGNARAFDRYFRFDNVTTGCPEALLGWDPVTGDYPTPTSANGMGRSVSETLPPNSFDRTVGPYQKLEEFGYNAKLAWQATDDLMAYFSYGRGFKGGGFDNRALANGDNPISPEFLDAYEIGVKSTWADGTVQINAAAYFYQWEDIQLFEVLTTGPQLNNIPKAENMGFEADVLWAPDQNWLLNAQFIVADSELTSTTGLTATSAAQVGAVPEGNPEFMFNGLVQYTMPVANGELTLMGQYRHSAEAFSALGNNVRDLHDATNLVNARATYNFGSELQHSVAVFGNNLLGNLECSGTNNGPGPGSEAWGCTVDRTFTGKTMWGVAVETNF